MQASRVAVPPLPGPVPSLPGGTAGAECARIERVGVASRDCVRTLSWRNRVDLHQLFRPEDLLLGFDPPDKWQAIVRLVEHLAARGRIQTASAPGILELVLARERSMSTGMERGIAIPHAAVEGIDGVAACMGIVTRPEGLDFNSIDARPARLIVLLVIPRAQKLLHIRTLADLARVLGLESVREALIGARDTDSAWAALSAGDAARR